MTDIRPAIAAFLATLDGLAWPNETLCELLAPRAIESDQARRDLGLQSLCGRTVLGWWRRFGCEHELLHRPYVSQRAPADVLQIARDLGAYRSPSEHGIGVGDVVVGDALGGGHWHAYTITALSPLAMGGARVASIDGGQGLHGASIGARLRTWPATLGAWLDVSDARGAAPSRTREVLYWVSCEGLGLRDPEAVPDTLRAT